MDSLCACHFAHVQIQQQTWFHEFMRITMEENLKRQFIPSLDSYGVRKNSMQRNHLVLPQFPCK